MLGVVAPELVEADEVLGVVIVEFLEVVGFHVLRCSFELFEVLLLHDLSYFF